jgi:uroporphyrinogen III methyltransferase/synthase
MSGRVLAGRSVVVTRARAQAAELADLLAAEGAEVLELPTIRIAEPDDWGPADAAIAGLDSYDWIVFTSANAVRAFVDRLAVRGLDPSALAGASVAAVGPSTAAKLAESGVSAAFVPDEHRAEGVLAGLLERGVGAGSRVLLPRALEAREVLPDELRRSGAEVDVAPVYRTVPGEGDPAVLERLRARAVDAITFTSASTARRLVEMLGDVDRAGALHGVVTASIGPVTSDALRSLGLGVDVESADSTVPGLVRALVGHYAGEAVE